MIGKVVGKTRLMRSEKCDVTSDLIAHFEDGMDRGQETLRLIREFGRPDLAAKLIRNSKIRSRSMFTKYARWTALGGLGVVGGSIAALVWFYLGHPNPSNDYLAELNAPIANVADGDRAWNVYRDVWARFAFCNDGDSGFDAIYYHNPSDDSDTRLIRPGDDGWERALAKLDESAELLESFRSGAKRPKFGLVLQADVSRYSPEDRAALFPGLENVVDIRLEWAGVNHKVETLLDDSMLSVLLPHVQCIRNAARMLVVDSRRAVEQRDTDRIVQNIETIMGLARQTAEPDFPICALVGLAINSIGLDLIDEMLDGNPDRFSDKQLERIQEAVASIDPHEMFDFRGERLMVLDLIQRIFTDDGKGDGRMTREGLGILRTVNEMWVGLNDEHELDGFLNELLEVNAIAGPASLLLGATRKETTEKLDEIIDEIDAKFEIPFWEGPSLETLDEVLDGNARKYALLANIFSALPDLYRASERTLANRDGVLLAIAAHRYRLRHGDWPESPRQLTGSLLREVPLDRVNGQPLKYRRTESGIQVHSVGMDRDDDGGKSLMVAENGAYAPPGVDQEQWMIGHEMKPLPAGEFSFTRPAYLDGDWIIWPRRSNL